MSNDTVTAMRRVQSALDEQRIELELFRQETAALRDELKSLRSNLLRYNASLNPVRRSILSVGDLSRDTARLMDRCGATI